MEVPPGAAPVGATIRVESRDPGERPDQLKGLPIERPFYELQPLDARFSMPVTVTRFIGLQELDIDVYDPSRDGSDRGRPLQP